MYVIYVWANLRIRYNEQLKYPYHKHCLITHQRRPKENIGKGNDIDSPVYSIIFNKILKNNKLSRVEGD